LFRKVMAQGVQHGCAAHPARTHGTGCGARISACGGGRAPRAAALRGPLHSADPRTRHKRQHCPLSPAHTCHAPPPPPHTHSPDDLRMDDYDDFIRQLTLHPPPHLPPPTPDDLRMGDYDDFIREGWVYLVGNDEAGNSVMVRGVDVSGGGHGDMCVEVERGGALSVGQRSGSRRRRRRRPAPAHAPSVPPPSAPCRCCASARRAWRTAASVRIQELSAHAAAGGMEAAVAAAACDQRPCSGLQNVHGRPSRPHAPPLSPPPPHPPHHPQTTSSASS
jgi:hypothetical protein